MTQIVITQISIPIGGEQSIAASLDNLKQLVTRMSEQTNAALQSLRDQVARIEDVGDSTIALLNGVSSQLREALGAEDPAAEIAALADRLDAQSSEFAAAVQSASDLVAADAGVDEEVQQA